MADSYIDGAMAYSEQVDYSEYANPEQYMNGMIGGNASSSYMSKYSKFQKQFLKSKLAGI
jgi:hypothetical protein